MEQKKLTKAQEKALQEQKKKRYVYRAKHMKEHYKRFEIRARLEYDQDIIEHLNTKESVNAYLKDLIRKDMEKGN